MFVAGYVKDFFRRCSFTLEDNTDFRSCPRNIHLVPSVFLSVAPPALSYNIALCYYSLKNYNQAVKYIEEIIERGIREHPGSRHLSRSVVLC